MNTIAKRVKQAKDFKAHIQKMLAIKSAFFRSVRGKETTCFPWIHVKSKSVSDIRWNKIIINLKMP